MWITRPASQKAFVETIKTLKKQVLLVRGARQVGKTSFILNTVNDVKGHHLVCVNLSFRSTRSVRGIQFYGRDFWGSQPSAEQVLKNLLSEKIRKPILLFLDEADQHPITLEAVQELAEQTDWVKTIFTGSNLENVSVKNVATGRRRYFDLYPVSFEEFLLAAGHQKEINILHETSLKRNQISEYFHGTLTKLYETYLRLGGMPKILDTFLDPQKDQQPLPELVSDLVSTIEDNIKAVLGDKAGLYEYQDVLRTVALLSLDTLKFSRLQVNHAGRHEAKRLVHKTVGARVVHKIRLLHTQGDLSKYIIFDCGVLNYLINGSDLLNQKITHDNLAIAHETTVGNALIHGLSTRDDLLYWKSPRGAQVEFILRSPLLTAIDVKTQRGDTRSLRSCAILEPDVDVLVKISAQPMKYISRFEAKLLNPQGREGTTTQRSLPMLFIPHYLAFRLPNLLLQLKN